MHLHQCPAPAGRDALDDAARDVYRQRHLLGHRPADPDPQPGHRPKPHQVVLLPDAERWRSARQVPRHGDRHGSSSYSVKWFYGDLDITAAVEAGTYTTYNMAANKYRTIEARVTAAASTPATATLDIDLLAFSNGNPDKTDIVRAHITRS